MRTRIFALLLTMSALMLPAVAQTQVARVQVALVDSLSSPDARAELVRFSDARPDIILLRASTATADDLLVALLSHEHIRTRRPARAGLTARTTFVNSGPVANAPAQIRRRAQDMLKTVKQSPVARIGNLGRGRWSEFDVR